jgi:hypothetical protein
MQNPTATGTRQTLKKRLVEIPILRTIQLSYLRHTLDLPSDFLFHEPTRTRSRATDVWRNQVLPTIVKLIQTRKSLGMNKHMRKVAFRSGMEKLMILFNQFCENVKVEFRIVDLPRGSNRPTTNYYLDFILLSPVAESIRNGPSCVAEIPEPTALAELVESINADVVVVGAMIEEHAGQAQTQSHLQPCDFSTLSFQGMQTTPMEDFPVVVATTIESLPSPCRPYAPICGVSEELNLLRREVEELRLENAILRSQQEVCIAAAPSHGNSELSRLVSPEVLELRQEMEDMRQMISRMMAQQQNAGSTNRYRQE